MDAAGGAHDDLPTVSGKPGEFGCGKSDLLYVRGCVEAANVEHLSRWIGKCMTGLAVDCAHIGCCGYWRPAMSAQERSVRRASRNVRHLLFLCIASGTCTAAFHLQGENHGISIWKFRWRHQGNSGTGQIGMEEAVRDCFGLPDETYSL